MSGEADGFFRFGCSGLIRAYVRSSSLPCVPGAAFPGCGTAPPAGRPGRGSRASSSLQVRSFPCRGPAAGRRLPRRSRPSDAVAFPSRRLAGRSRCSRRPHRASSAGYRHPSSGNSCIRRKPVTPEHRAPRLDCLR